MEELKRFRQFLAEGKINESELPKDAPEMTPSPIKKFLDTQTPEEWVDSWDNEANTYSAPYEKIELVIDDQDLPDYGVNPSQLPTDWVKFAEYSDMNNEQNYKMMNFAKYVPGEGLYMGVTTDKTDEPAPNPKDYDMVKDLINKGYSPEEAEATAARITKDNDWLLNKKEMNEAATNQEIVAKVVEFINGPLTQIRKEVYAWEESFGGYGDDTAYNLRYALSEANKEIKKALTGVKRMK